MNFPKSFPKPPKQSFYGDQFSARTGAQTRVNASTFQVYKACPRKYYYSVLLSHGKSESDPDLRFGGLLHEARAIYKINRSAGMEHDLALQGGFRFLLHATWDFALAKPSFVTDALKNRATLLRSYVWYCDQYRDDACETVILPSGRPAVEMQFEFDSGVTGLQDEQITFVGKIDELVRFNSKIYVSDTKTTSSARFVTARNYTPDGQFSLYVAAATVCFGFEPDGVILDGVIVGPNATEFHREIVPRPPDVIEEWLRDARVHLHRLTLSFADNEWPQNDAACGLYGGCRFRGVCGASPRERDALIGQMTAPAFGDPK